MQLPLQIKKKLSTPFLRADVENIVPSDESITILVFQLSINILFCLLKGNVEVAVQAGQDTCTLNNSVSEYDNILT